MVNDAFELKRLELALGPQTVRYHASVESSNDLAMTWLREGAPAGACIIADEQRQGRGRLGRNWVTPAGQAIAVSMVLRPVPSQAERVTFMGALAVAELCEQFGAAAVGIKWPNDVQINGRKVSGVLPEAAWEGDRLLGVVLGIGVNIRVVFLEALQSTATNLEDAVGQPLNRTDVVIFLVQRLRHWMQRLDDPALMQQWRDRLTSVGQSVRVGEVVGVVESVDDDGALRVRTSPDRVERVIAGDLSLNVDE